MKRNPDGTFRNARHAVVLSDRFIRARWVRAEIIQCKRTGLSMADIAVHLTNVGQGREKSLTPLPNGVVFDDDYRISESVVFKAYHKAMTLQPVADAEVLRKEDTERCEQMYLRLQRGISTGDPRYIDGGVRVLAQKAKLNGYPVEPEQGPGVVGFRININLGNGDAEKEAIPISALSGVVPKKLLEP